MLDIRDEPVKMSAESSKANKRIRRKHIPQRTCVGCREINSKRELIRIVRVNDGISIDPTGKQSGRGAYLHNKKTCWEKALRGPLGQALRKTLSQADIEYLNAYASKLPDEEPA
jgi:uncharacterized protein